MMQLWYIVKQFPRINNINKTGLSFALNNLMIDFYIDRGGTFTDIFYQVPESHQPRTLKLLSHSDYGDGVIEGIRRIQAQHPLHRVGQVVIGSTIITNAVLEKKGLKCALLITHGFADLLQIGQQARTKIFDLTMKKPPNLYEVSIEIEERVTHDGTVLTPLNENQTRAALHQLKEQNFSSLAVVYLHSSLYPQHEQRTKQIAFELGFQHVSLSSEVSKVMKAVPRGLTTVLDAYVNPLIKDYVQELKKLSQDLLFMTSDGGLVQADEFRGSRALLSGPAGGVVGLMQTSSIHKQLGKRGVVGLDMGGTSTDVSVYYGQYNLVEECLIEGIPINSPQFDIQTVAAGGGSILRIENGLLKVGPESSGASPGPVCYGRNGKLSLTDANLLVGNIVAEKMPKIFGLDHDSYLQRERALAEFELLGQNAIELAEGFIRVADEQMCRPIRSMTTGRGRKTADHLLFIYGGAGGQHCCQIADILDIDCIYVHKYASIFSAYGLSFAKRKLVKTQAFVGELNDQIHLTDGYEAYFHLKYEGSDCLLKIRYDGDIEKLKYDFAQEHRTTFGFVLNRKIVLEYITEVKFLGEDKYEEDEFSDSLPLIQGQNLDYEQLPQAAEILGPLLIFSGNTTIKLNAGWKAQLTKNGNLLLRNVQKRHFQANPQLQISLFANRFMSIAEEMGKQLQNTAVSINIKERLDFSCALFDSDGNLVANAPHLPVHLGSMSDAVKAQINRFEPGDVILSNHPSFGGSHLPDLTVISPYFENQEPLFYVASRGHHADIGGIAPGSMPAFSKLLSEEGAQIASFKVVAQGCFREKELREILQDSREQDDNVSDIKAQIAANNKGIELIKRLIEEEGQKVVFGNMRLIQQKASDAVGEMLYRMSLQRGIEIVHETEHMDDGSEIKLMLMINRETRSAIFDFGGTSLQGYSNINCPLSVTKSAILYCLRCLIDIDIPLNQGCLERVKIIIPENSLLNPAQVCGIVGGNVLTSQRVTDLILKCFKASAASQGCMNNLSWGGKNKRSYYETIAGGSGAGPNFHGESGVQVHMTNTRITDIEVLERKHPVRLHKFTLRKDSGGKGKHSGGNGVIREIEFLEELNVSLLTERRVFSPFGLLGGQDGKKGENILIRGEGKFNLGGKVNLNVYPTDRILILTPGGGGFGPEDLVQ